VYRDYGNCSSIFCRYKEARAAFEARFLKCIGVMANAAPSFADTKRPEQL
jgi:hypothetical protein